MLEDQATITTTIGTAFDIEDTQLLAMLILNRFGNDYSNAAKAWRRLLQNSCSENDFRILAGENHQRPSYLVKVTIMNDGYEETQICLVDAQNENQAGKIAIQRCARDELEWEDDLVANDCNGEIKLKIHSAILIKNYEKKILDRYCN
jgi:hypothetical protein